MSDIYLALSFSVPLHSFLRLSLPLLSEEEGEGKACYHLPAHPCPQSAHARVVVALGRVGFPL